MTDVLTPLIVDLVDWVAQAPRTYQETMEIWRTSCPRLMVWEDAVDRGYLVRKRGDGGPGTVEVTEAGREFLLAAGRGAPAGGSSVAPSESEATPVP